MTTEEKYHRNNRIAYAIFTLTIAAYVLLLVDICNHRKYIPPPPPTHRDKIITRIDTLKVHDKVLVDRWHKAIHTTDSVVKLVYFSAPDTCDSYLHQIISVFQNERDSVLLVVNSKDSIITQYSLLSKSDSTSISILADSISNHKCRRTKAWLKGFAVGFGSGVVVSKSVEIINKLK